MDTKSHVVTLHEFNLSTSAYKHCNSNDVVRSKTYGKMLLTVKGKLAKFDMGQGRKDETMFRSQLPFFFLLLLNADSVSNIEMMWETTAIVVEWMTYGSTFFVSFILALFSVYSQYSMQKALFPLMVDMLDECYKILFIYSTLSWFFSAFSHAVSTKFGFLFSFCRTEKRLPGDLV